MPYLTSEWGNPSSAYKFGAKLKGVVETAGEQVAELIGASGREIVFTSCATESSNAAIRAALEANPGKRHIVTSVVEHSSVLNYCKALEKDGYRVTYLPVDRDGLLKLADLENAVTDDTAVVSLMWANNETGVLSPVKEIAKFCRSRGCSITATRCEWRARWRLTCGRSRPITFRSRATSFMRQKASAPFMCGGKRRSHR